MNSTAKTGTADDALFDQLGPRARARLRTVSIIATVVLLAVVTGMLIALGASGQLDPDRWAILVDGDYLGFLATGLGLTLVVGLVSTALSVILGVLLALGRISRSAWLRLPCAGLIEFFRAMPLLLILFFIMFAMPMLGLRLPTFWQLVLAIVAHASAIFAEIVRAGILSIGSGQSEAGKAIGLRHREVMGLIVLPQATRALTPALITQMVRTIKESSLGYVVGLSELLNNGKILSEFTGNFIQSFIGVGLFYIIVNIVLSRVAERLTSRVGKHA
ncbi:amino acid ABC transporter permease [Sciscionella sediminilitoris]|uniref:amino acid ABC transporter permease n=1 Tax=Sciscionella sediminilitoris TaxID=1445613 RepID=UPI0004DF250A|nr:amino acid ABC transporter permease [Sciscionella sp. SE31]